LLKLGKRILEVTSQNDSLNSVLSAQYDFFRDVLQENEVMKERELTIKS
jgi:hypothetical protein